MSTRFFKDKIIAYKQGEKYLAVSLEFNLMAEGKTIKESLDRLHDATSGYLQICCEDNETDEEIYRKAPKKYQDLYQLFVELTEKKKKDEEEKKREKAFLKKETQTAQYTYSSRNLTHA